MMTHNAAIRDDGWVMRDLYLFRVKTPAESKAPWDYDKLLSKIDAQKAAPAAAIRLQGGRLGPTSHMSAAQLPQGQARGL
jgi:hypothetical protein